MTRTMLVEAARGDRPLDLVIRGGTLLNVYTDELYSADVGNPDLEAPPDYGTLARLAPVIAELGLPLAIHAEDPGILKTFRRPYETYADVLAGQPPEAEAVAISAAAAVARQHGIHLHIAHLSSAAI